MVQVNFQADTEFGQYSDAIYYTMVEWDALTDEQLEIDKKERVDNFVSSIKNSQQGEVVETPTEDEVVSA